MVKRKRGKAMSMPAGILAGAGAGLASAIAGAVAAGNMLDRMWITMDSVGYAAMVILLISSFLAAQIAWNRVRHQRVAVSLGAGGVYYLTLLAMTALFFGGQYTGMGVTGMLIFAGCGCSVMIGLYRKSPGNQGKYGKRIGKIVQSDHR